MFERVGFKEKERYAMRTSMTIGKQHRLLTIMGALFASLLCAIAISAPAYALPGTPVSGAFSDYQIEAYSVGDTAAERNIDQHVRITIKDAYITNGTNAQNSLTGDSPTCTITIAGRNILQSNYYRYPTISESGDDVIIDIDHVNDGTDAPFTAQYSGVITVVGTLNNVFDADDNTVSLNINTVIPTGFALNVSGEGTDTLTVSASNNAQVRGMIHLGIYTGAMNDGSMVYTPICTAQGTIETYTYTIHAHQFATMAASDYMSAIAALATDTGLDGTTSILPNTGSDEYAVSLSQDGSSVTISGPSGSALYMGVYDDNMLQAMGLTFTGRNTGTGELTPSGASAN